MKLFLASSSVFRANLLRRSLIPFEMVPPDIDEDRLKRDHLKAGISSKELSLKLAVDKATSVSAQVSGELCLGCDQVLEFQGETFGKPSSPANLEATLKRMSGQSHILHTAQVIVKDGKVLWSHVARTKLFLRNLSDQAVGAYIDENWSDVQGCAGGYLFEKTPHIFEKVEGNFTDILGLSVSALGEFLKSVNVLPTQWQPPKFAAVLGHPIAHSKSPTVHNHWLQKHNIGGEYLKIDVPPDHFSDTVTLLFSVGFSGFNVTIPHKHNALQLSERPSQRAQKIGAANTLYLDGQGSVVADNTDGVGFLDHLKQSCPSWKSAGQDVLVLGAGGAARAVVSALLDDGCRSVILTNRTGETANTLASRFASSVKTVPWDKKDDYVGQVALVVNTTSLGMTGMPELNIDLSHCKPGTVFYDLVYAPLETDFLRNARQNQGIGVDGLGMLLHQAVPGFEAWFGCAPDVDDELRQLVLAR